MSVQLITAEDLERFRQQLIKDIEKLFLKFQPPMINMVPEGLKTCDVRQIFKCSAGKLQLLRAKGKLHCKKVGGTLYYDRKDVIKLLQEGFDVS